VVAADEKKTQRPAAMETGEEIAVDPDSNPTLPHDWFEDLSLSHTLFLPYLGALARRISSHLCPKYPLRN